MEVSNPNIFYPINRGLTVAEIFDCYRKCCNCLAAHSAVLRWCSLASYFTQPFTFSDISDLLPMFVLCLSCLSNYPVRCLPHFCFLSVSHRYHLFQSMYDIVILYSLDISESLKCIIVWTDHVNISVTLFTATCWVISVIGLNSILKRSVQLHCIFFIMLH